MKNLILALDQGTTGSTALLMETNGTVLGSHNVEFPQIFPQESWVEHNPEDILKSIKKAIEGVLEKTNQQAKNILTIGITNQRETVVYWDRTNGKSIGNAIVWQCRRTTKRTQQLIKQKKQSTVKNKTGLPLDPYFSSTKMEWFIKNMKHPEGVFGNIDTYLLWQLTGGKSYFTEPSNASRTQLFNIKKMIWDEDLLKLFKVKKEMLPEVIDSNSSFGVTKGFDPLPDGIPITGILGDQQAALFGQGAFKTGEAKCTFGTGSFLLFNTGEVPIKSKSGLLTTVGWKLKNKKTVYALEGGAFNCGSTIQWLRDSLKFFNNSADIEKMALDSEETGELLFIPSFSGMGAPLWEPRAKGAFLGITRGTQKTHMARAVLEGLSYQNAIILNAMEKDLGKKLSQLYVDGGASKNNLFMEIQSDFLAKSLSRPKHIETTALGAAFIAGLGAGVWSSLKEIKSLNTLDIKIKGKWSSSKKKHKLESYEKGFSLIRAFAKK